MSRRKPRTLRPEEQTLWSQVAATATPLNPVRAQEIVAHVPEPDPDPVQPPDLLKAFEMGAKARQGATASITYAPPLGDRHVQMDHKAFQRLKRGKLEPEARIDLHGMTLARAHPALLNFILSSHGAGRRLVLVITGKGKDRDDGGPIPTRRGVLRHQVPDWLRMAPIGPLVLQVTEAHLKHGGLGAYYVYLRRTR